MDFSLETIDLSIDGRFLEIRAAAGILPGMIVKRLSDGTVTPHDGTGPCVPLVAMENRYAGANINTAYAIGDTVYIRYCLPGDTFVGRFDSTYTPGNNRFLTVSNIEPGFLKVIGTPPLSDRVIVGEELNSGTDATFGTWTAVETI